MNRCSQTPGPSFRGYSNGKWFNQMSSEVERGVTIPLLEIVMIPWKRQEERCSTMLTLIKEDKITSTFSTPIGYFRVPVLERRARNCALCLRESTWLPWFLQRLCFKIVVVWWRFIPVIRIFWITSLKWFAHSVLKSVVLNSEPRTTTLP